MPVLSRPIPRRLVARCVALLLLAAAPSQASELNTAEIFNAILKLRSDVPTSARTAAHLGLRREGHAVVIDSSGLALTIGYLILEAEAVTLTTGDGTEVPARIVAYDHDTGFGLVKALHPLGVKPIRLGDSAAAIGGTPFLAAGYGGTDSAVAVQVVSRRDFAGYWEYLLEDAIFTSPPFAAFGGAALIDSGGRLVGIGSLIIPNAAGPETHSPGNMFIPINALKPIMADLLERGRSDRRRNPWIGLYTTEQLGHLFVQRVAKDGPAARAGIAEGDIVVSVGTEAVSGQMDFYRKLWASGGPGTVIRLGVLRRGEGLAERAVTSIDRYEWLKFSRGN